MKKNYKGIFTGLILATLSSLSFAESDPLIGKWKTIDDRTGYSRADVEISKKPDGTYEKVDRRGKQPLCAQQYFMDYARKLAKGQQEEHVHDRIFTPAEPM
jgi:hypothetical protein